MMSTPLRVLILEDRPEDAEMVLHELWQAGFEPIWQRVDCEEDYLEQLALGPEVILSDYTMPRFDMLWALDLLQARGLDIPFIVVSGTLTDEGALECVKRGADDYIFKDRPARLGRAVARALQDRAAREANRQAEAALRASEERFRVLAENSQDVLYRYRLAPPRGFDYVSPAISRITGYTPEEFYADPDMCYRLVHSDDMLIYRASQADFCQSPVVLRWVRKDGAVIWTEQLGTLIQDEAGKTVAFQGIVRDITERKRAEEDLLTYKLLFDHTMDIILFMRRDGRLVEANSAAVDAYGYDHDGLLSMTIDDLRAPETRPQIASQMAIADSGGMLFEALHLRKDGSCFPVEVSARGVTIGGERFFLSAIRDISERKRSAAALREGEARYRTLVDAIDDAISVKDLQGRYVTVNAEFLRRSGLPKEDVVGKTAGELYEPEWARQIDDSDRFVMMTGEAYDVDTWRRRRDSCIIYHLRTLPLRNDHGDIVGLVTVSRDVTERRDSERILKENEARFRRMAETPKSFVFRTELRPSPTCSYISPHVQDIVGYSPEEFYTDPDLFFRLIHPEGRAALQEAISGPVEDRTGTFRVIHRDGHSVWLEQRTVAILDDSGALVAYEGLVRDITERKHSEEELSRTVEQLRITMEETVQAMALTTELRDPYTAGHQRMVSELAAAIAQEMGVAPDEVEGIRLASIIHDIGKVSVPAEILSKPGQITDAEFSIIKIHPQSGREILSKIEFPWPIARIVGEHHERLNGSGYPEGLSGNEICLGARILAVADVVEAMASHRPYRPALGLETALDEIARNRGTLYDCGAVDACLAICRRNGFKPNLEQSPQPALRGVALAVRHALAPAVLPGHAGGR
jgi:PAS domain S-box-containing protein/putative nucleotidyltransferase with HDIG domain